MKKKIISFLAIAALVILTHGAARGASHSITEIYCLSSNVGTSAYLVSSALEDLSKKHHPWLKVKHSDSPGLVYDIKKLHKDPGLKKNTFISVTLGLDWLAQRGLKPFDKKHDGVKMIANYNMGATWLATLDSKIKTGKDLIGKKIALGRTTQVIWGCEADWLIHLGWGIKDKAKIQYVGNKDAPKALLDGLVDAAIIGGYIDPIQWQFIPGPPTLEFLASGRNVYHIPWGEEAVRKTIAGNIKIVPLTLPANTVKYQKEPLEVFADPITWVAYPEFPDEYAYELTKLIIDNVTAFKDYHAVGKLMSPKGLPFGWDREAIHPGALRAYKEAGILK